MKRIRVNKDGSFEAANKSETQYYKGLSSEVRVEAVQLLRETHFKFTELQFGEEKKLRRVLSVIKQA